MEGYSTCRALSLPRRREKLPAAIPDIGVHGKLCMVLHFPLLFCIMGENKRKVVYRMKREKRTPLGRRILGDVLILLAVALAASVLFVMPARINAIVQKRDVRDVFNYQLILCAILLLFALDVRFNLFTRWKNVLLKGIGWLLRAGVALLTAAILFFCGKVIVGGLINTAGPADYAIVLGLALENGEPAPDLLARLNTGKGYLEKQPAATLILTGGNPDASGRTEAAVMRDVLTAQGVPESRLLLEDQARSTRENFRNIAAIEGFSKDDPVVMISSNYHMDRAVRTAKSAGFARILRLPAPSDPLSFGANVMWEVILDLNELKLGV